MTALPVVREIRTAKRQIWEGFREADASFSQVTGEFDSIARPLRSSSFDAANKPIVAEPTVADAREKAAVSGLLQFKDSFADMRDAVDVAKLNDTGAIRRGTGDGRDATHVARSRSGVNVAACTQYRRRRARSRDD